MKFRQAKKIVKQRNPHDIGYNSPSVDKAIVVYIHHRKKKHSMYEKHGYIRVLRLFYEKRDCRTV